MGGHHLLDAAGVPIQNTHLGGVAVSHVADGVGYVLHKLILLSVYLFYEPVQYYS